MTWWAAVSAIFAAAIPLSVVIGGLVGWFVRNTVRQEILDANAKQSIQFNGTYVRSAGCNLTGAEIQRILAELKADLADARAR